MLPRAAARLLVKQLSRVLEFSRLRRPPRQLLGQGARTARTMSAIRPSSGLGHSINRRTDSSTRYAQVSYASQRSAAPRACAHAERGRPRVLRAYGVREHKGGARERTRLSSRLWLQVQNVQADAAARIDVGVVD